MTFNINRNGIDYVPIIHEDNGGTHNRAVTFYKRLAIMRASALNIDQSDSINFLFQKISCTLQKANAISLLNHYAIF